MQRVRQIAIAASAFWRTTDRIGLRVFATSIAYRAIFTAVSFVATLLVLMSLVGANLGANGSVERVLASLPDDVSLAIREQAQRAFDLPVSNVALAGIVGIVFSLWGMAGGLAAVYDALNRINSSYRYTPYTLRYARGMAVAALVVAFTGIAFVLSALGTHTGIRLFDALHLEALARIATGAVRTTLVLLLVWCAFTVVLRWGSRARPRWRDVLAAATVSASIWTTMAWAYFTITPALTPYAAYGALAGALLLLLFGYWSAYLLLLTALFAPTLGSILGWVSGSGVPPRIELAGGHVIERTTGGGAGGDVTDAGR